MANSTAKKKWTIMTYMAGDNNLDVNGVIDLKEMKKNRLGDILESPYQNHSFPLRLKKL